MAWLARAFRVPAHESNIAVVLAISAVTMSLLSLALVWQAQVIANQREAIHWLERLRFGS